MQKPSSAALIHYFSGFAQFPQIGRKRDELYPNLRSFPYKQYLVFYRLLEGEIEVFRVVSGYQDLTALFEIDE